MTKGIARAGPYSLLDVVHRGPRAVVYLAARDDEDQQVILKMATDPIRSESPRESAAARRLVHRHIVRVLDEGDSDGFAYLVMERLHGRTLRELMSDPTSTADLAARIDLIAQVCMGLHYGHEHQLIHGNVTPDNIFVTEDGLTKILNFGATSVVDRTVVSDNALAGSFEYMSPEQIIGRDAVDGRSDIFSAAIVLYELVAGRRPFQAGSTTATLARVLRDDPPPLEGMDRLNTVLRRALQKEPGKRYASAQEFAYALWMMDILAPPIVGEDEGLTSDTHYGDAAEAPAPGAGEIAPGLVISKQVLVYTAIAAGALIAAALAFASC